MRDYEKEVFVYVAMAAALDEIGHVVVDGLSQGEKRTVNITRNSLKRVLIHFKNQGVYKQEGFDDIMEHFVDSYNDVFDRTVRPDEEENLEKA